MEKTTVGSESMSEEGSENEDQSENEVHDVKHAALIDAVSQLSSKQRVKPPTRKEPSLHISEFHLSKSSENEKGVHVDELAKVLKQRSSHAEIEKKLRAIKKKSTTLPKPLEKVESEKIKREVGFENLKKDLSKWDSIVHSNREAPTLTFPLSQPASRLEPVKQFVSKFKPLKPGTLEAEFEAFFAQAPHLANHDSDDDEDTVLLTLEEMIERRKEMARLRARQSYKEAKAARQSKIKSKKYHRIERRAKLKEQLKTFEALQKTDPEAALKQLEDLERVRVEERMSLRHRTTGKWAKSKAIRAKYDPESRKALAEQLALSRQLTEKIQKESSSGEDEEDKETTMSNTVKYNDNPWLEETSSEVNEFLTGYRKYWEERNKNKMPTNNKQNTTNSTVNGIEKNDIREGTFDDSILHTVTEISLDSSDKKGNVSDNFDETIYKKDSKNRKLKSKLKSKDKCNTSVSESGHSNSVESSNLNLSVISTSSWTVIESPQKYNNIKKCKKKKSKHVKGKQKRSKETCKDDGERKEAEVNIDDLFDRMEQRVKEKVKEKINSFSSQLDCSEKLSDSESLDSVIETDGPVHITRKRKKRVQIDDQLEEVSHHSAAKSKDLRIEKLIKDAEQERSNTKNSKTKTSNSTPTDIDPNSFLKLAPKTLSSGFSDIITAGDEALDDDDNEAAEMQKETIAEAFAGDDVISEFRDEKKEAKEKSKPQDIDLTLPGWGEWVGPNSTTSKRKKRRLILKFPEETPRKDDNKGNVIINEEKDIKIKEHQVTELPFPFDSVKDFEASVRAPIGNTWVPESAHRKLIKPDVITQLGAVIEPMDEDVLVNKKKT